MAKSVWILLFLLGGCAPHARLEGIIEAHDSRVTLMDVEGRRYALTAAGDAAPLARLDGCIVEVEGPRAGRRVVVQTWAVKDAGDGSAPFVGVLERFGSNWIVHDRTTGQPVLLEEASVGALAAEAGRMVLVRGFVVGVQTVRVVAWRPLEGEPAP